MSAGAAPPEQPFDGSGFQPSLAVPPAPLRDPGGGRRSGAIAIIVLAGMIGLAVGVAQLAPAIEPAPRRTAPTASGEAVAASPAGPSGEPQASGDPQASGEPVAATTTGVPRRLSREDLAAAVADGSLDGRLVFVDGQLRVTSVRCQRPAQGPTGCVDLEIGGLGLPVSAGENAIPWPGDPPPGSWLVTVARTGGLVYLGSLVPSPEGPVPLRRLTGRLLGNGLGDPPSTLFETSGYLVVNPVHTCYLRDPDATPCPAPQPFLAEDEPAADGILRSARGAAVDLVAPIPGVDPAAVVTAGTFLVGLPYASACRPEHVGPPCTPEGVRWQVVARYEPALAVRVLAP